MLSTLISILIAALVLYLIYYLVGKFMSGTPLQIVGIILGLVFLLYALRAFGFVSI
jgi:hypothetical protein